MKKYRYPEYQAAWYRANASRIKARNARNYEKNKEKRKAQAAAWYKANKEKRKAKIREWQLANKDKFKALTRAWQINHPERWKELRSRYRQKHKDRLNNESAAYREKNPAKVKAIKAAYRKNNPWVDAKETAQKRARILLATPAWANKFFMEEAYDLAARRSALNTGGHKWHVDHIVPLKSRLVCGLHTHSNLQVIPMTQNLSKGNRHWPDMP